VSDTDFELFIAYETASGRIVGAHHGPADASYEWKPIFGPGTHVEILRTSLPERAQGKHYAVDISRKELIETVDEEGVSFGFGPTGGVSARA
jgi:hypothetical protein